MDLRSKIKKALTEDNEVMKYSKWDMDSQRNLYNVDKFLRKSGYRLLDATKRDGVPELFIKAMKDSHLYPDITHHIEEGEFFINVIKYGELNASDVEEIIKGYEAALGVVHYLNDIDMSSLEIE